MSSAQGRRHVFVTVTDTSEPSQQNLARLLTSLADQDVAGDLVLVARGGSVSPPAPSCITVHLVPAPLRIGLSSARNLALRYAQDHGLVEGEGMIAFPDDDASYPPGLLVAVDAMLASGQAIVCGPYAPTLDAVDWRRFPDRQTPVTPSLVMRAASSNNVFLSLEVARRVGLFDERMGLGAKFGAGEDSDYVLRALGAGFSGTYQPSLVVCHPYKAHRPDEYYRGNVAVLAKHARSGSTRFLLARRLATGVLLTARRRLRARDFLAVARSAAGLVVHG